MSVRGQSAAAVFLAFVLALVLAMFMAALLSPVIQAALAPLDHFPLHRVFSRLTMLGVIGITIGLVLHYRLNSRAVLGYGTPRPVFLRRMVVGLAVGIALMAAALAPLFLLGVREWNGRAPADAGAWALLAAKGLGSGLLVALIEESFFRGAMQGALERRGATRMALLAVPVFYSAVHFLGRAASVPFEEVNALSGFTVWAGFFSDWQDPERMLDAFVALWFVGLLLAMVRQRWGDIAGCIGLHAGFVTAIAMFRKVSVAAPENDWSFLVGNFDGLLGGWIALLTAVVCVSLLATGRGRPR